ncbi:uncharacterized protein BKA55DRAFT_639345 [Fusarium redolens]|uniref:C2H2-type domain-containing protein n=1 Tax=Fusarium redolens TaxID=48865 RepID=A0A9P9HMZ0_FUSRE|nr:uncharacterized protein BKA55DRAFT_639345 [Fusarium redolens]KAH7259374.1 hypothetical protein BKA55DRAFT_639345 [Fusarium redolens]
MDSYDDVQSTPTGKVSKAKKGKPVHVCSECQKVYTRAEHLRRHQSSHQEPQFECPVCQRRFHRKDLLERHYKRIHARQEYHKTQHKNSFWHSPAGTSTMRYISHTKVYPLYKALRGISISIRVSSTIEAMAANRWSLPIALISHHSPYLKAMSSGPGIFVKAQIHLPEDDPAVFGLFVEWLYYGTYDDLAAPSSSNIHAQCWVLGDKLLCNEFKNYAMSRLYKQRLDFSDPRGCGKPFCKCHLNDPKDYIDFDEVYFTAITPSAAEPIRLPVRKKKRKNKKPKCGANIKSEKNISENIFIGVFTVRQDSPGGNASELVQGSTTDDENDAVVLASKEVTNSRKTVESKECVEGGNVKTEERPALWWETYREFPQENMDEESLAGKTFDLLWDWLI